MTFINYSGNRKTRIVILGAGISGLWSAFALLKTNPNLEITILEKQTEEGGLFNSSDRCGFHFNHGLFLFPTDSPLIKVLPHRFSPVAVNYDKVLDHRMIRFPVDPSEMKAISRFTQVPTFVIHMLRRTGLKLKCYCPSNLDDWLKSNMPVAWSDRLRINDYIYKLMGHESWELSQDVGKQRLEFIARMFQPEYLVRHITMKLRMLLPRKLGPPPSLMHHHTLNSEGTQGFIREFADRICSMGANIHKSVNIRQITNENDSYRIHTTDRDPLPCDLVISTIPITELATYRGCETVTTDHLKWRNLTLFFFVIKRVVPEQPLRVIYSFNRAHCWKRVVIHQIDERHTGICVEVTGDQTSGGQHEKLAELIRADLAGVCGVIQPNDCLEWDAIDVPYGYPCLLNGYNRDYFMLAEKILDQGIYSLGRQGKHQYATSSICAQQVELDIMEIMKQHALMN